MLFHRPTVLHYSYPCYIRGEMIEKARRVLRPNLRHPLARDGCLLLIEPLSTCSLDGSIEKRLPIRCLPVLSDWVTAIEAAGFRLWTHERLFRSHAISFVTTKVPPIDKKCNIRLHIPFDDASVFKAKRLEHGHLPDD